MPDSRVVEYIRDLQAQGYRVGDIRDSLLRAGWPREEVDACIAAAYGRAGPEPPEAPPGTGGVPVVGKTGLTGAPARARAFLPEPRAPGSGSGSGRRTLILLAAAAIISVAVAALIVSMLPIPVLSPAAAEGPGFSATGLQGFLVSRSGTAYTGATGTLRISMGRTGAAVRLESVTATVDGVTGEARPGTVMAPGADSSFIITGLPAKRPGDAYAAYVALSFSGADGGTGTASGSIMGSAS
jgi:hypothetical protein